MPELPTDDTSEWASAIGPNGIPRINITAPVSASPSLPLENQTNYIMEPDLVEAQQGRVNLPPGVALNDAGIPFNKVTGKEIPIVRRPNVLPVAQKDQDGNTIFAMPKMLDIFGSVMSPLAAPAVATKAGEVVLGSGAVRTMPEAAKAVEPAQPFFSTLEQVVDNARLTKGDASQWLGYLKNQPGVKSEEINTVLGELPQGQITKDQLAGIVRDNGVKLGEVVKWNKDWDSLNYLEIKQQQKQFEDFYGYKGSLDEVENFYNRSEANTKYEKWQLPGGENYKEMLLTLPKSEGPYGNAAYDAANNYKFELHKKYGDGIRNKASKEELAKLDDLEKRGELKNPDFKSSHWDEPNIVAHVRYNDRNVEGTKTLHLEEVQSDWHQKGRAEGYKLSDKQKADLDNIEGKLTSKLSESEIGNPDIDNVLKVAVDKKVITPDEARNYKDYVKGENSTVPDAPFKKNWDELALKRMLHKAATEGYDALSWTPGEAQAARYDLSKHADSVFYDPKTTELRVFKGDEKILNQNVSKEKLADTIGKEAADKLLNSEKTVHGWHKLEGEGLKIGGEGMKSFYDKMLVDKANALAKKYGSKVESKEIDGKLNKNKVQYGWEKDGDYYFVTTSNGDRLPTRYTTRQEADAEMKRLTKENSIDKQPIHFLRLTPELRQKAAQGFPLFSFTPTLTPVTHNPFTDQNKNYKLTPIQGNPFQ